ncbi:uncharacterized protein LOC112581374 isoform X2 [Bubalus bubalis]|uniref:uncharacterized protein LOC112581374 isoform X2 n=1 Tax=Bubalus bubalis TaxID=89462 RepID=UPI001E1B6392|nr:uncharacterized protein LOC112581374 isoform X2 [Bubalus bubalis]XP_044790427.2 uncharacterized protein LOC112581374 isoform X2 [Bubalus bubalis]XP_044790428.2 uncharacterized protein LOC112581374 isoform X2 [Bubalus bubalis]
MNRDLKGRLNKATSPAERVPSINHMAPVKRFQWKVLPQDGEEIWVPLCHVRYREGPQDRTPSGSDEVDEKGLVNEETPSSESLPDTGSSEKHDLSG